MSESVKKKSLLYSAYGVLCFAAVLLYAAAWLFSDAREKVEEWERSPAVVVDMVRATPQKKNVRTRTRYRYIVEFTAADGQQYRVRNQTIYFSGADYDIGEKVEVVYPGNCPEKALIPSFRRLYIWCTALALVGGAQAIFGAVMLVYYYRRESRVKAVLDWVQRG